VTFWDVFHAVVLTHGAHVAVEIQRAKTVERWTYRELHDTALAYAAILKAAGAGPGDRCAIFADNDARWCAAYLGTFRLGAIAVPLDTNYSAAQVAAIVGDARPKVVLVNERLTETADDALAGHPGIRRLKFAEGQLTAAPAETLASKGDASDVAVILYTSGTTADPKGVVLTHANLIAERDAAFSAVNVGAEDSVLGVLPLFHALAQLANLLLPFAIGARVVFLETLHSTDLVRALAERRITVFACVPQFFYLIHQRITDEVSRSGLFTRVAFRLLLAISFRLRRWGVNIGALLFPRIHALLGLQMRLFVTGGSRFDPSIGRDFYALGFTILQAYGLTETSGAASITTPDDAHADTVGRPLPGQEIRILPAEGSELDGEIAIRGPIVTPGYFNRPDATAAVFRDGWFLSGDLGRLDSHGRLTITGRKKEVIVLASGKNIYPEEVEAQYRQSAYIKEICVMGVTREDHPASERLYAVVVPNMDLMRERRIANAGDLVRFEIEGQSVHLPPHKRVLGYEVWLDPLPRTTTGKIKRHEIERRLRHRQRLPHLAHERSTEGDAWSADPHARAAVAIIRRRAREQPLAPNLNLELDLGFDSMERVELIAELEQRFGVRVPDDHAHDILTVQQLVDAVRSGVAPAGGSPSENSWAVILRDLPPVTDPVVAPLLLDRRLMPLLFFAALRGLRLLMPRMRVTGVHHLPAKGPYLICPNHQSYLDPFFVCSVLPYRVFRQVFFVGAAEYFETRPSAWLARQLRLVPVDPDANLVPAMKAGAFGLRQGLILVLFPEGERSIDGTVKRFKKGGPILSRQLDVPIVPVAIHGIFELWPRNRPLNWRLLLPFSGHRLSVAFGEPLRVADDGSYTDSANRLRESVAMLWDRLAQPAHDRHQDDRSHAAGQENG
jgi:long-chain acyl-CoA synthetase